MSEEKKNAVQLNDADLEQVSGGSDNGYQAGDGLYSINESACLRCGVCVDSCPVSAIEDGGNSYQIGPECFGCGACVSMCPAGAICES